ncbi:MAG TPA: hypothetical protein VKS21_00170 [Spirochaetota bacterium]|nr:hypothetical protein [Spirochaetota bacterium]
MRINRYTVVLLVISAFLWSQTGSNSQFYFEQANNFYRNRQYQDAIHIYQQLLTRGITNSMLYYNLANSYLKSYENSSQESRIEGALGKAIAYYHRAMQYAPDDSDIKFNLRYAKKLVSGQKDRQNKTNPLIRILLSFYYLPGRTMQMNIAAVCLALSFIMFLLFFYKRAGVHFIFLKAGLVLLLFYLLFFIAGVVKYQNRIKSCKGVITETVCEVKTSPGYNYSTAFKLNQGEVVTIRRRDGEWVNIFMAGGYSGWVPAAAFIKI